MKQVIFILSGGVLVVLAMIGIITVESRHARENEVNNALHAALDETMDNLCVTEKYTIDDQEEMIADFTQLLLDQINGGSKEQEDKNFALSVEVMGCDVQKGLLSVQVSENFTYPNGKVGCVKCDATMILEQTATPKMCQITYRLPGRLYKQYQLQEKTAFVCPKTENLEKEGFLYWRDDATGEKAQFPETVTENKIYTAVFRGEG